MWEGGGKGLLGEKGVTWIPEAWISFGGEVLAGRQDTIAKHLRAQPRVGAAKVE